MNATFTDASPELLRAVVDFSLTAIYAARAVRNEATGELIDFQIYFGNPAFCQRVRLAEADLQAQTLRTLFPVLNETGFFDHYRQVVETGEPFEGEQEYPGPNGHFWYRTSVKKLDDGIVVNFIDITPYKQVREQAQASAQLLDEIVQVLPNGLVIAEAIRDEGETITDFRVKLNNPAARRLAGLSVADIGQTILTLDPPLRETGLFDRYVDLTQKGEPFGLEYTFRGRELALTVSKLGDGFITTFTDVTARKRAEETIQQKGNELQTILDTVQAGVGLLVPVYDQRAPEGVDRLVDFRLRFANRTLAAYTGQTPDALVGSLHSQWFSTYRENGIFEAYRQTYKSGETARFEQHYVGDGLNVWVDIQVTKLGDDLLVTFTDISHVKQAQLANQQQAELLSSIFNGSLNGQFAMQAMRDDTGAITDFKVVAVNRVAAQLARQAAEVIVGRPFGEVFPGYKPAGLFDQYVRTVERGKAEETLLYYPYDNVDAWYWVGSEPFGDGVILTFLDITSSKQTELKLQQTNGLLQAVLDGAQAGITAYKTIRDAGGRVVDFEFLSANSVATQLIGHSVGQLVGQRMLTVFPTNQELGIFDRYVRVIETGQPQQFETHYQGDGLDTWFDVTAVRQHTEGAADDLVLTFLDISDRKRAELDLQQQTALLQTTLDASISSILAMTAIRDEEGQIVDFMMDKANRSVERSLGKTPAELEGRTLLSVYPGNIESGFFALYARTADTGEPQQATYLYTDVNGYEGWFEASSVRQAQDKIVLTFMNVTEYKQNEQLVRQQSDLVNSVLNATLTAVATYQPVRDETGAITDFRFTLANQASLNLFGLPADELYTKTLCELNPPLRGSDAFARYVAVVETGEPVTQERQIRDRWYMISAVRFAGNGLLTSSIDITEAKQAREQLDQLNAQLQRSNESLDQFASVASHDLQEPLRKIKSFGDLLADQYGTQLGDGMALLERMQSAAERMQTLIRDLLDYARLSKSDQTTHKPVDLGSLVNDVLADLEVAVAEKGALVDIGELPTLPGAALQLRQAFQNLLSNALKFTKPGQPPRVTVSARPVSAHELPAEVRLTGQSYWQITVADNGIGFSETYRERIFGAFERLHGKNSQYSGSGIGLAIVRRVMDNHRGAVLASSVEGEGATFTVYLPASSDAH